MRKYKPVAIPSAAFAFCRYSMALLVWLSFILRIKGLLFIIFIIFLASAILKIRRAPMIVLYSVTFNKIIKSREEILDETAMRFAHIMGSSLSFICLLLLYGVSEKAGWYAVLIFGLLKSISAFGFCPASKLYECAMDDKCCAFLKRHDR